VRATGLCCWALFLSGFLFFLGAWSFARVGAPPHLTLRHVNGVRGFKRGRERHTGGATVHLMEGTRCGTMVILLVQVLLLFFFQGINWYVYVVVLKEC